jgi:hypothetical protein
MTARAARHLEALRTSSMLTEWYRRMHRPKAVKVTPENVIRALNEAGLRFVLIGTHGLGDWRDQPRATHDIDLLVAKKDIRKAVDELHEEFPSLEVADSPASARFIDPALGYEVIDVKKPMGAVFREVFRHSIPVGKSHRIPELELAIALKFAAMFSPDRRTEKKFLDAGDCLNVIAHNRSQIDLRKLERWGDMLNSGDGSEIIRLIDDFEAGRKIDVYAR